MSEIKLTNEEIEKRIHNAYLDGRADALDEYTDVLCKVNWDDIMMFFDVSTFLRNIAEQLKEQANG